jgi:hypothetical protein
MEGRLGIPASPIRRRAERHLSGSSATLDVQQGERGSGLGGRIVSGQKTEMPGQLVVFGVVTNEGPRHDGLLRVTLYSRHAAPDGNPTTHPR